MRNVLLFVLIYLFPTQKCEVLPGPKCLACNNVPVPTDCGIVLDCGSHQQCFIDTFATSNGHLRYNLGCRDTMQCGTSDQADLSHSVVDKRSSNGILICSECCQGPLCNNAGCGYQGYPADRGPLCYSCPDQLDYQDCEKISMCGRDEVCYDELNIIEQLQLMNNDGICFVDCCKGDLCNSKCNNTGVTTTTVAMTTTALSSTYHCQSNPCISGTCSEYGDTYICSCEAGVWGRDCENGMVTQPTTLSTTTITAPDFCSNDPCIHGKCSVLSSTYICQCETGFWGRNCENALAQPVAITTTTKSSLATSTTTKTTPIHIDHCKPNPCVHGECHPANASGFLCVCSSGYHGATCDFDACASNPCLNGGTCFINHNSRFSCHCDRYHHGKVCDLSVTTTTTTITAKPNVCHSYHCYHGGHCHIENEKPKCICSPDHEGQHCENSIRTDLWIDGIWNNQHNHWETSTGAQMIENPESWYRTLSWGRDGYCTRFRHSPMFKLNDINCDAKFGFICEYTL